jgi:hypothetical protein
MSTLVTEVCVHVNAMLEALGNPPGMDARAGYTFLRADWVKLTGMSPEGRTEKELAWALAAAYVRDHPEKVA